MVSEVLSSLAIFAFIVLASNQLGEISTRYKLPKINILQVNLASHGFTAGVNHHLATGTIGMGTGVRKRKTGSAIGHIAQSNTPLAVIIGFDGATHSRSTKGPHKQALCAGTRYIGKTQKTADGWLGGLFPLQLIIRFGAEVIGETPF